MYHRPDFHGRLAGTLVFLKLSPPLIPALALVETTGSLCHPSEVEDWNDDVEHVDEVEEIFLSTDLLASAISSAVGNLKTISSSITFSISCSFSSVSSNAS